MVGPGELAAVRGLHGRDDAERGEAPHGVVRDRLDVLDAVSHRPPVRGPCLLHGVQDMPYRRVADGVRGGGHAGRVQFGDHLGEACRVRPEGVGGLAVAVGAFQPGGAVVDRAVHEQLHPGHPPQPAARPLEPDQVRHSLRIGARLAPGRHPQPQRQRVLVLQRGEGRQGCAVGVHRVATGQPGRGHGVQHLAGPGPQLVLGGPGCDRLGQFAGGVLQQQSGGPVVGVAHDLRGLLETARPVDPGQLERPWAGQQRVPVEQVDQGWYAVQDRSQ